MPLPPYITTDELMAITGWSRGQHDQLSAKGFFPRKTAKGWATIKTLNGIMLYLQRARGGESAIEKSKLRKLENESELLEIEKAKLRGELLSVVEVDRLLESVCVTVREKMLASSMSETEKNAILTELGKLESYDLGEDEAEAEDSQTAPAVDAETKT